MLHNTSIGQKQLKKIEIKPFQRIDWYPEFSYNVGGRPSTDYLTMRGASFGIISNYKHSISSKLNIIAGIGFYNYSFNKLKNINSMFGTGSARVIDYPSPLDPIYTTDRYFYQSLFLNVGTEKKIEFKNNMLFTLGVELQNFYTISQRYHLASRNINFKKEESRYFGSSILLSPTLIKRFKKIEIGPSILIPVYDSWKKDDVFPGENNSESRHKWLRGIGWGISTNFLLIKKT